MAMVDVTDQWLKDEADHEELVLIDFWAPWCGPCQQLAPVIDEIDQEIGDQLKIAKVNCDYNQNSYDRFNVMSIPKLVLLKKGEIVEEMVGFQPKERLLEILNKYI